MVIRFSVLLLLFVLVSWESTDTVGGLKNQQFPNVSLSLEKQNSVLYIGIDNPFTLHLCDISYDKVIVNIDNGGSIEQSNGYYIARVRQKGATNITISHKGGAKKELAKFTFLAKHLPDPVIKLGNYYPGNVPLLSFKLQKLITAELKGFGFDLPIKIVSYDFVLVSKESLPKVYHVQGHGFPPEVLESIKATAVGDYIIIDAIKIDLIDGRTLPAVVYRLI